MIDQPTNFFCTVHRSTFHSYRLQNVPSYFPFLFFLRVFKTGSKTKDVGTCTKILGNFPK